MKTSNAKCREFVNTTRPFQANHLFAENRDNRFYVVYSYGHHWPLWVYDRQQSRWYGNTDRYSVTTARHKSQSHPTVNSYDVIAVSVDFLKDLLKI